MYRYRFVIEYKGTEFHGWQRQPNDRSIQQCLEEAIKICLRSDITILGSGRTDTGVHAQGQVAHFDFSEKIDVNAIEKSVNHLTPTDIYIRNLESCSSEFHARYSATYRHYRYSIIFRQSAFLSDTSWFCPYKLDLGLLENELKSLIGLHDFNDFSIPRNDGKSTECEILIAKLEPQEIGVDIIIRGNRFLHRMVRSIVGACYDVSRKKHTPGLINSILSKKCLVERTWAPSVGLSLIEVGYNDYEY